MHTKEPIKTEDSLAFTTYLVKQYFLCQDQMGFLSIRPSNLHGVVNSL
jgi:hypothetical protein